jgi:hypothetical protein
VEGDFIVCIMSFRIIKYLYFILRTHCTTKFRVFFLLFFLMGLGFECRASRLQGRHSAGWATSLVWLPNLNAVNSLSFFDTSLA